MKYLLYFGMLPFNLLWLAFCSVAYAFTSFWYGGNYANGADYKWLEEIQTVWFRLTNWGQ